MKENVTEGAASIRITKGKATKRMPVFYNPAMRLNRDVSVLLLDSMGSKGMRIADPLAATGIRSIRILLELKRSAVKRVFINDVSKDAAAAVRANLKLNGLGGTKIVTGNEEANLFLLKNRPFDYVDVDPFGSPVGFLDSATSSLSRNGILAVTATDTAALSGTAPGACLRKYWAHPLKNYMMHEFGLRMLIRRAQMAAASREIALFPVYSYSALHYMRVFLRRGSRASDVNGILDRHGLVGCCVRCFSITVFSGSSASGCGSCRSRKVSVAGPMWTSALFDAGLAARISRKYSGPDEKFLKIIAEESRIDSPGFYDTHVISGKFGKSAPKLDSVLSGLRKLGYAASRTHLNPNGIRTDAGYKAVAAMVRKG